MLCVAAAGPWGADEIISDPVCRYRLVLKNVGEISVGIENKYLHDTDKQYLSLLTVLSLCVGICRYMSI